MTLSAPLVEVSLRIGNTSIRLKGADKLQLKRVVTLWSQFFILQAPASFGEGCVRLYFASSSLSSRTGEVVYAARALSIVRSDDGFDLRCGASQLHVSLQTGTGRCFLAADFFTYSFYEQREFFLLGLLMLLRPHGLYGLHACGLERGGKGLLLVGQSGSGKTTTTLNLLQQGWCFLSDDAVLLRQGNRVEALAFRKGFSCTPKTLAQFPDLTGEFEFDDPEGKRVINLSRSYGGGFRLDCTPSTIVFPTITGSPDSALQPLSPVQSLIRLSQQSAGIMTDTAVSNRQLELLKSLALQTQSFELRLGKDALETPEHINQLLGDLI